jgi:hypothetical protein
VIVPAPDEGDRLELSKTGPLKTALMRVPDPSGLYEQVMFKVDNGTYSPAAEAEGCREIELDAALYGIKNGHELAIQVWREGQPWQFRPFCPWKPEPVRFPSPWW